MLTSMTCTGPELLAVTTRSPWAIPETLLVPLAVAAALVVGLLAVGKVPLSYNLRNLTVRWKTTIMTALAFTLVISLLTVMLAFVNGMYRLTEASGQPGNVILLSRGSTDESFSNLGFSDVGDIENQPGIERDGDQPLCSRETYVVVNQPLPGSPEDRPKRRFLQVRGVEDPALSARVHGLNLLPGGQWFSQAGVEELAASPAKEETAAAADENDEQVSASRTSAIQAVIGEGVARVMGRDRSLEQMAAARNPDRLDVGDRFILGDRTWVVTGVMQSSGSSFDSEIWSKRAIVAPMFGKNTYSSLVLRTAGAAQAQKVASFFNKEYKKAPVQALVETEYFASLSQTNQQFLVAIIFVAIVMAIGGIFGVMNTMFAAISQRIKDIGVLRILGFARWQILVSFLLESVVIAILGGLMGCALGSLADGWTANSIVSSGQGGGKFVVLRLIVDAEIIGWGVLLSVAMGTLGGLVPALSAMRMRPLEALR